MEGLVSFRGKTAGLEGRENRYFMVDRYLLEGWEDGLAADLRSRLAADFTGWQQDGAKFEEQFERVVRPLRPDHGALEGAREPHL